MQQNISVLNLAAIFLCTFTSLAVYWHVAIDCKRLQQDIENNDEDADDDDDDDDKAMVGCDDNDKLK